MSFITANWQLKLLALVMSLGLFGAVAFAENPPTNRTVDASIEYDGLPSGKILVRSPSTFPVDVTGTADAIHAIVNSNVTVRVDASKVKNGSVTLNGHPQVAGNTVRPLNDNIPIQVTVDDRVSIAIPVDTRISYAEGWQGVAGKTTVSPAAVNVTGAASELKDLKAFVSPAEPIAASSADIPSLPIQFEKNGHPILLPNDTNPPTTVDTALIASLHVEAVRPNQTTEVPVVENPTGNPAPGYRITAITLDPLFVSLTGPADDLAGLNSITLTPISVDGASSTISRGMKLNLPPNISSTVISVSVTITIQRNPVVQTTPPPPIPSPSP